MGIVTIQMIQPALKFSIIIWAIVHRAQDWFGDCTVSTFFGNIHTQTTFTSQRYTTIEFISRFSGRVKVGLNLNWCLEEMI